MPGEMHFLVKCQKQKCSSPALGSQMQAGVLLGKATESLDAVCNSRPINKSIKPIKQGTWHSRELTLHYSQCNFEKNVSTRNGCDSANVNANVNVSTYAMAHLGASHCLRLGGRRTSLYGLRRLWAVGVAAAPFAELLLFFIFILFCWQKMWKIKNIVLYACIYICIYKFRCIFYRRCFYAYFPQHIWSRAAALKSSKKGSSRKGRTGTSPFAVSLPLKLGLTHQQQQQHHSSAWGASGAHTQPQPNPTSSSSTNLYQPCWFMFRVCVHLSLHLKAFPLCSFYYVYMFMHRWRLSAGSWKRWKKVILLMQAMFYILLIVVFYCICQMGCLSSM